ncbi:MAG: putative glycosyltransferase, partial [Phenylobacterium sp.]
MKIWIDLANTPHVVFFDPIIKQLEAQGHTVLVTLRDFAQTISVAKKFAIEGPVIGGHGGGSKIGKIYNLAERTMQLWRWAVGKGIDLALSHNSYHQIVAGRLLGCKVVTLMDYEGQPANHLAFRAAHRVIVPRYFPTDALQKFGATPAKTCLYDGFKEQVYLNDFTLSDGFVDELAAACDLADTSVFAEKVVVTVRTPPALAAYHQFENDIFPAILHKLNQATNALVLVLPRTEDQKQQVLNDYTNLIVPKKAVDGRDLCVFSDLVISAGGTMNREAALLGTPAYSTFAGVQPAVDKALQDIGMMFQVSSLEHVEALPFEKKAPSTVSLDNQ